MSDNDNVMHGTRCNQADNIKHLKSDISEIKKDLNSIFYTLDGNGKPGMKTDLAIVVKDVGSMKDSIEEIKQRFSTVAEIDFELEVSRRVNAKMEQHKIDADAADDLLVKRKSFSWTKFAIAVATLGFLVTATFQVLNYELNKSTKTEVKDLGTNVEELGVPIIKNSRGEVVNLPEGYKFGLWPKDFTKKDSLQ